LRYSYGEEGRYVHIYCRLDARDLVLSNTLPIMNQKLQSSNFVYIEGMSMGCNKCIGLKRAISEVGEKVKSVMVIYRVKVLSCVLSAGVKSVVGKMRCIFYNFTSSTSEPTTVNVL
jgi:hypothetical protein